MCQVEEAYIGAEEFCARLQQDEEAVLNSEALVAQALNFDLVTHSPYTALAGLFTVSLPHTCPPCALHSLWPPVFRPPFSPPKAACPFIWKIEWLHAAGACRFSI